MHDLNTINELNARAHAKSIKTAQDAGRYVIATFAGLTLLSTQEFHDEASAQAAFDMPCESPDQHRWIYLPTPKSQVVGARDQSEDRA